MACKRPKTTAARVVLPLRPFFPLSAIPFLASCCLLVLMKYVRTCPVLSLTPFMYISPRNSSTKPQSARILCVASGTWIFPLTPVLSIRLAKFTVMPQISYWGLVAPMTPATTGPWAIPRKYIEVTHIYSLLLPYITGNCIDFLIRVADIFKEMEKWIILQ